LVAVFSEVVPPDRFELCDGSVVQEQRSSHVDRADAIGVDKQIGRTRWKLAVELGPRDRPVDSKVEAKAVGCRPNGERSVEAERDTRHELQ